MNALDALADPTRRKIVELLADNEMSAGDIAKCFTLSAPAISQHLKILREARVLRVRVQGQHRIYQIDQDGLEEIAGWINGIRRFWAGRLDVLEGKLRKKPQKKRRLKT